MYKKIILLLTFLCLITYSNSSFAGNITTPNLEKVYSKFIVKLERKYRGNKKVSFLVSLNEKLDDILVKKKLSTSKVLLVDEIIKLTNEKLFSLDYDDKLSQYNNKLKSYSIVDQSKIKSSNAENIFLENGVWYYYSFSDHLYFPIGSKFTNKDLVFNNVDLNKHLVFLKDDGNIGFTTSYRKIRLISDDIIFGIPDKFDFLVELKDDKKTINTSTDDLFISLKAKSISLTHKKTDTEKLKAIYNYILENISYPTELNLGDNNIYSGIDTYRLSTGACEGYTKLFNYMAKFAGVNDIEVIRGFVIDAVDFPEVGHAWIRIGDRYFDPTFDDPVGNTKTLTFGDYKYFDLPKDIFYTNRYLYDSLPVELKTKSMEYRKDLISKNLSLLVNKYNDIDYNLLKGFKFKDKYGFKYNEVITLSNFNEIKPLYQVDDFSFTQEGETKTIKSLSFFTLNTVNIGNLLQQLKYDLDGFYFFKWNTGEGQYDYRLAYNVVFN